MFAFKYKPERAAVFVWKNLRTGGNLRLSRDARNPLDPANLQSLLQRREQFGIFFQFQSEQLGGQHRA